MSRQEKKMLELIHQEVFSWIDLYFAQSLLKNFSKDNKETHLFLLGYLLACARQGHLCIQVDLEKIIPAPDFLTVDPAIKEEITREVLLGIESLSFDLYQDASIDCVGPILKPICRHKDLLYLQKNWLLETNFLFHIKRIVGGRLDLSVKQTSHNELLNEKQKQAIDRSLQFSISLISGGPGTGKTFTAAEIVKTVLSSLSEEQKQTVVIKIAAPTGKAAAQLEKGISRYLAPGQSISCGTLHSLLQIKSKRMLDLPGFSLFADLLLIDEASMLDARLFTRLLSSMQEGGRIVFIGDSNQLPPVEAGSFFADLMQAASMMKIPSTTLTECLRVERKDLIDLAVDVFQGSEEKVLSSPFVQCLSSPYTEKVHSLLWDKSEPFFSGSMEEMDRFRILSCIRKGPLGVDALNEMILHRFIEPLDEESIFTVPILITENHEPLGLMNGDTGFLVAKVSSLRTKRFSIEDRAYFSGKEFSAIVLPEFEWGYCLSVHKSQGSEYESVIALAPVGSEGFGREVLYTAITRAKKELLVLGEESTLRSLLSKSSRKSSGISQRLFLSSPEADSTRTGSCSAPVFGSA